MRDLQCPRIRAAVLPSVIAARTAPPVIAELPQRNISPELYIETVCRENKSHLTPMRDKLGKPMSADGFIAVKCEHGHPHRVLLRDLADDTAKCVTCVGGTAFSRKVVAIMKHIFGITILLKEGLPHLTYHNPVNKIEIICASKSDLLADNVEFRGDVLVITINQKHQDAIRPFLRNALQKCKNLSQQTLQKIKVMNDSMPFGESAALLACQSGADINEIRVINDNLMFFENC